jgi:hypothetical protein
VTSLVTAIRVGDLEQNGDRSADAMFDCACFRSETGNKQKHAAQNNTMQQPVRDRERAAAQTRGHETHGIS